MLGSDEMEEEFEDLPNPAHVTVTMTNSGRLIYGSEIVPNEINFNQNQEWPEEFQGTLDPKKLEEMLTSNLSTDPESEPEMPNPQPPPVIAQDSPPLGVSTRAIIHEVSEHVRQIASHLEKLKSEQRRVPLPISNEHYTILERAHVESKHAVEYSQTRLNNLINTIIMEPSEMDVILQLLDQLALQQRQCDLFSQELKSFVKPNPPPIVSLTIVQQPFPASVKQNKPMEDVISVRLLCGAKYEPTGTAPIRGEILHSPSAKNKKNQIGVENADKIMSDGLATFNDLKFPNGTRKKTVRMKFVATVSVKDPFGNPHNLRLESAPTKPFVVKTNENQWHEAEGTLLQESAFNGHNEIPWERFMNWLLRYYLIATRQTTQAPLRILTPYDFEYLHQLKFGNSPTVSQKSFDQFWAWLGPMLHKIRYQRHICSLWTRGYICGFLTKNEVEAVLQNEKVGTFLIRFSERVPGAFVVSYQSLDDGQKPKVKHYLMQVDDTYAARKTLPDFLGDIKHLSCLLQLWYDAPTRRRILRRCDKDQSLREFYSKREQLSGNDPEGYVTEITVI